MDPLSRYSENGRRKGCCSDEASAINDLRKTGDDIYY